MHPAGPRIPLADYRPRPTLRLPETRVERAAVPAIDAHNHLGRWITHWVRPNGGWMAEDVGALLELMDAVGVEAVVNLDGRWGGELEANLDRCDRAHPGRFMTFCHVDWAELAESGGGTAKLVASLEASHRAGARGLKVWKDLGLGVRDGAGALVLPDDERIAPVWEAAGGLGLPVLIHTADPIAFFQPIDATNERLEELAVHPEWAVPEGMPTFERLMEALEAVVAAHPGTTFVAAHACCCAEDLEWVGRMLRDHPNLHMDFSQRIAELGRQPRAARRLFTEHADRVLFGTDELPPSREAFRTYFRFLETADEHFAYSPDPENPWPQGRWRISGLDLPPEVLPAIYRENALRVLGRP